MNISRKHVELKRIFLIKNFQLNNYKATCAACYRSWRLHIKCHDTTNRDTEVKI
jgi:hypothetical protein